MSHFVLLKCWLNLNINIYIYTCFSTMDILSTSSFIQFYLATYEENIYFDLDYI